LFNTVSKFYDTLGVNSFGDLADVTLSSGCIVQYTYSILHRRLDSFIGGSKGRRSCTSSGTHTCTYCTYNARAGLGGVKVRGKFRIVDIRGTVQSFKHTIVKLSICSSTDTRLSAAYVLSEGEPLILI
jgi:hypothetical protein